MNYELQTNTFYEPYCEKAGEFSKNVRETALIPYTVPLRMSFHIFYKAICCRTCLLWAGEVGIIQKSNSDLATEDRCKEASFSGGRLIL